LLPASNADLLPAIVPMVADTNFLLSDALYSVAHDRVTAYQRGLRSGSMRCFAARHVLPELQKHLLRRARERGLNVDQVIARWQVRYAPFLRFVDVADCVPDDDRVRRVATRHINDAPTAALAVLLAPVHVLTEDPDLIDNGFGDRAWLVLTQAAGDLGAVDEAAMITIAGLTIAVNTTTAFIEQVRGSRLLQNVLLVAAGAIGALATTHRRRLPSLWQRFGWPLVESAGTIYFKQLERRRSATALLSATAVQPSTVELSQDVSRLLAVASAPLTATAIARAVWERQDGSPYRNTFREVRELLTTNAAFVSVGRHGWTLGAPCIAALAPGDG